MNAPPPSDGFPVVLIVDDELKVAETTGRVLAGQGPWRVVVTHSSRRAMDVLSERTVAVVVADLVMPEVDGTAVLEHAARVNPATVGILVTGQASKDVLLRLLNAGCIWKCIEKPWRAALLRTTVSDAFRLYRERAVAPSTGSRSGPEEDPSTTPSSKARPPPQSRAAARGVLRVPVTARPAETPAPARVARLRLKPAGNPDRAFPSAGARRVLRVRPKTSDEPKSQTPPELQPERARELLLKDTRYRDPVFLKRGGSALVFKARDSFLDMTVAIKIPIGAFSPASEDVQALMREAGAAMQISHKHMVRLHDIHPIEGLLCLVMEFIDGGTMRELIECSGPLPTGAMQQVLDVCADVFDYTHRHGVLHRDIKPDNLMIREDGMLKIIDFGLAGVGVLGKRKHIRGTPFYVSPEEVSGKTIDGRSDLYSLGVTTHELLTGALPVPDEAAYTGLADFVPVCGASLPPGIRTVLDRAFAPDPGERWPDVASFAHAFRKACKEGQS